MSYKLERCRITRFEKETADTILLRVKTRMNPGPGEFVEVSMPGIGEAPISIASHNPKYLDLNVRVVGNVTRAMTKLKKGNKLDIRGPYGKGYPMTEFEGKNLIIIGGGSGVAPLRGILKYVDKNRLKYKEVNMFFGFRSPEDVLFKPDMKEWKDKYHLTVCVDKVVDKNPMNYPVGFVTDIFQQAHISSKDTAVFLCGPPIMMDKMIAILNQKGFKDEQLWISLERHMKCCTGKCGHCMIHGKYVCIDGPVFRYDEVKGVDE